MKEGEVVILPAFGASVQVRGHPLPQLFHLPASSLHLVAKVHYMPTVPALSCPLLPSPALS